MSMKAHPDYLQPEKRWLAFKIEGSPPFLPVRERTRLLRHFEHFTRGMVRGTSYGHVTPWPSKLNHMDIYSFYEYGAPLCEPLARKGAPLKKTKWHKHAIQNPQFRIFFKFNCCNKYEIINLAHLLFKEALKNSKVEETIERKSKK